MQAIFTKYLGPTNHRGSRIRVTAECGSITVPWDHSLNQEENHRNAAMTFAVSKRLHGKWSSGSNKESNGLVFVNEVHAMSFEVK